MEAMIETIRRAVADGATSEAKKTGAAACRTLLTALEAEPGTALAVATPPPSTPAALDLTQALDLAIAKLRSFVGEGVGDVPPQVGYQVPILRLPEPK
jgi:hypothetical protein